MPTRTTINSFFAHFTSHEPAQSSRYFTDGKKILAFGTLTLAEWIRFPQTIPQVIEPIDAILIRSSGFPDAPSRILCVRLRAFALLRKIPIVMAVKTKKESLDLWMDMDSTIYKPRISRNLATPTPRLCPKKKGGSNVNVS